MANQHPSFDTSIIDTMTAVEWMNTLAERLKCTHVQTQTTCLDCEVPIKRGVRCEDCRKKRHAAFERARAERKKLAKDSTV